MDGVACLAVGLGKESPSARLAEAAAQAEAAEAGSCGLTCHIGI